MNILALLIQLLSGAAGGNAAGILLKKLDLGPIGNSITGIIGGIIGGQILQNITGTVAANPASMDLGSIASNVIGGGVGGGIVMSIIGMIHNATGRRL